MGVVDLPNLDGFKIPREPPTVLYFWCWDEDLHWLATGEPGDAHGPSKADAKNASCRCTFFKKSTTSHFDVTTEEGMVRMDMELWIFTVLPLGEESKNG
ncbi:hypothetical protein CKAN_02032600 [Cinnamomum micranthum f. kanehirae]|uniref:Uncharacterized protein n=1 Tax=Cinnamomum micranthum f. kanehirae TaxID=337451 RepID=A0A3S3P1L3_9MAGN|nr:hypothetical protein CKAN_02032600 [Cinnamomum micranthum f. kanehirae]